MIIIFGPSASGKTEVANMLSEKYKIEKVITCTTRSKRLGEKNNVDYHFLTKEEFLSDLDKDLFVEHTFYNNNYYGTRKSDINTNKVIVLDPKGVYSFLKLNDPSIIIFYLSCKDVTRFNRMVIRKDKPENAHIRIEHDKDLFKEENLPKYNYIIDTDKLTIEEATDLVYSKYIKDIAKLNKNK